MPGTYASGGECRNFCGQRCERDTDWPAFWENPDGAIGERSHRLCVFEPPPEELFEWVYYPMVMPMALFTQWTRIKEAVDKAWTEVLQIGVIWNYWGWRADSRLGTKIWFPGKVDICVLQSEQINWQARQWIAHHP